MKVLELFAGSRSIGKAASSQGHQVFSVDLRAFPGVDLVRSVLDVELHNLPWIPDFIWASPPCTTYSLLAISTHRPSGGVLSAAAIQADLLVQHTWKLIDQAGCWYAMENPRATLRSQAFQRNRDRRTITYCSYGDNSMKPTDVWSNMFRSLGLPDGWEPRPICHNNNPHCHHDRQPRNYATRKALGLTNAGTTGKSNAYERSKLPPSLCAEVIQCAASLVGTSVRSLAHAG